jgi:plasmid stabilization system protein ParE
MQSRLTLPRIPLFTLAQWCDESSNSRVRSTNSPVQDAKVGEFDDENLRELIAYSYRIIYRVEAAEVIVVAVIHGKRDLGSV